MVGLAFWISSCGLSLRRTSLKMISYYTPYGSLGIHVPIQVITLTRLLVETAD